MYVAYGPVVPPDISSKVFYHYNKRRVWAWIGAIWIFCIVVAELFIEAVEWIKNAI